jgi:hypothetical protein
MKRFFVLLIVFNLFACDYFEKRKVYTEDLLEEELQTFNWNDVDEYPSFDDCNSLTVKAEKKACFENKLRSTLNTNLARHAIVVSEDINDTITLEITIDKFGELDIEDIQYAERTGMLIPNLDSLIRNSIDPMPKIYPAIKRSQQVTTKFTLPIIVQIN